MIKWLVVRCLKSNLRRCTTSTFFELQSTKHDPLLRLEGLHVCNRVSRSAMIDQTGIVGGRSNDRMKHLILAGHLYRPRWRSSCVLGGMQKTERDVEAGT